MKQITLQLIIVAYQNDRLQTLLDYHKPNYYLLTVPATKSLTANITEYLKQFDLKLDSKQITVHAPHDDFLTEPVLNVLIQLTNLQATQLSNTIENLSNFNLSWYNMNALPAQLTVQPLLQQQIEYLIEQYRLFQLHGIHWLLPDKFTAQSLSALLSNLTGEWIKPNNVRRTYADQIKFIGKDHSHKGNPKNIFKYQPLKTAHKPAQKDRLKNHENLRQYQQKNQQRRSYP